MMRSMPALPKPGHLKVELVLPVITGLIAALVAVKLSASVPASTIVAGLAGATALLGIRASPHAVLLGLVCIRATLEASHAQTIVRFAGIGLSLADGLTIAMLGGVTLWLGEKAFKNARSLQAPTIIPALLLMAWLALSLVHSGAPSIGGRDLLKFASGYCVFLLIVVEAPEPRRLRMLLGAIAIGSVVPIGWGLWQGFAGTGRVNAFRGWTRVQSTFDHPNTYGFYLVTVLAAIYGLRREVEGRARRLLDWLAVAALVSLLLTLSRNSMAALSLLILVVGWRERRVILASIGTAIGVILIAPQVLARGLDFFTSAESNSLIGRLELWAIDLALWRKTPLMGQGWGSTAESVGNNVHSDYMRALVETGPMGLIFLIALVASLLRMAYRASVGRKDAPRALLGLALGYTVVSIASNTLSKGVFQFHFWLLVGVFYVWSQTIPVGRRSAVKPKAVPGEPDTGTINGEGMVKGREP